MAAAPQNQTVRFNVVSWTPFGSTVVAVGNHPALGSWDPEKAPRMSCSLGNDRFESEPDYWWADVELPADEVEGVHYKYAQRPHNGAAWQWDEGDNRSLCSNGGPKDSGPVLLPPVEKFHEGTGLEHEHTGRFWKTVNERKEMSVRRVSAQIVLGSCPRRRDHVERLKQRGVTAVMNFQTEADCLKNCVEGIGMEENALAVGELYQQAGIEYIWLPTWDMSTAGRSAMLPHASFVMSGLIRKGHVVYVHCNAGVGRSVAAVCGYLYYCLGLSPVQVQHIVARARTVAFFDMAALEQAKPHYEAMFGGPIPALAPQKRQLLEAAQLPVP